MLSWMMAHAMKSLSDKFGPDCLIFPSLRGQPLLDWLEQEKLKAAQFPNPEGQKTKSFWDQFELDRNQQLVLTPSLPNRFLAVVPAHFDVGEIEHVFCADGWETQNNANGSDTQDPRSEWAKIVGACWRWLDKNGAPVNHRRAQWDFQVRNFWRVTWKLWPWQTASDALELCRTIPLGRESSLYRSFAVAHAIPQPHRDDRCYKNGKLDPGWAWNAHYQLLSHRHDARRQTRGPLDEFSAFSGRVAPAGMTFG
jgi:CRISPR-associated protein Cmr2